MNSNGPSQPDFNVLVAGGGVAALEGALALGELAGDRVSMTLLAPNQEFLYRPMTVREPFGYALAQRYPLEEIAREIGVELCVDGFKWLDSSRRLVHTTAGRKLGYDALLLALGARRSERFRHAVTLDDSRLDDQLHGLVQDVEGGYARHIAFLVPSRMAWPLPIYELALMTAARAYDANIDISVTIATPEDAPLSLFGSAVSSEVQRRLDQRGIQLVTSAHCEVPQPGQVVVHPGSRELWFDRVVALPELYGPSVPGVPCESVGGFIAVDVHGKVRRLERVYAAGDATDFAIKHGGIAAQQADVAASSIAALAGASVEPERLDPLIRGMLLGGDKPLYLSARLTGSHGSASQVSETPLWSPPSKIAARYLGEYLDARDRQSASLGG
jgi:sulfide:quinone oxidoreductase